MKVTIVIPVYNTYSFLRQCVDSVLTQSYTDWKIILIDDGSDLMTHSLCDDIAISDERIEVIHKENTGVSDSKNLALDRVCSEYVMFLDSDDYWTEDNILDTMVNLADTHRLDIVRGAYHFVDAVGGRLMIKRRIPETHNYEGKILDSYFFLLNIIRHEFFMPLCLFRTSCLCDIRFTKGKVFLEDVEFMMKLFLKPLRCSVVPCDFYAYRRAPSSISLNNNPKKLEDAFNLVLELVSLSAECGNPQMSELYIHEAVGYYARTCSTLGTEDEYYRRMQILIKEYRLEYVRRLLVSFLKKRGMLAKNIEVVLPISLLIKSRRLLEKCLRRLYEVKHKYSLKVKRI